MPIAVQFEHWAARNCRCEARRGTAETSRSTRHGPGNGRRIRRGDAQGHCKRGPAAGGSTSGEPGRPPVKVSCGVSAWADNPRSRAAGPWREFPSMPYVGIMPAVRQKLAPCTPATLQGSPGKSPHRKKGCRLNIPCTFFNPGKRHISAKKGTYRPRPRDGLHPSRSYTVTVGIQ